MLELSTMKTKRILYPASVTDTRIRAPKSKNHYYVLACLILFLALAAVYVHAALIKPLPMVSFASKTVTLPASTQPVTPWPAGVSAGFGTTTSGVLDTSPSSEQPRSIASIAKVITALAVTQKKPLSSDADNIITFSAADEELYHHYAASDGSYVPIHAGDQLSEYRALEAMLLPSANNMADSLAIWAFGSMDAYASYATNMVKSYGLKNTTITEASGFNDTVLSTPSDLIVLGQKLLANTELAQIVMQQNDTLPILGKLYNTNQLLGNGVNGIKTGHTTGAGYCLLLEKNIVIDSTHTVHAISAVLGAGSSNDSFSLSDSLIKSVQGDFGAVLIAPKNAVLGTIITPWGARSDIVATADVNTYGWKYTARTAQTSPLPVAGAASAGTAAGSITVKNDSGFTDSYNLVLKNSLKPPSKWWRLTHYF
ncbi:MAG: peptidase D-alanyl-D-alanine carboxypeptidase 1, D-alanyl-D-alanine carboxypeptidase [Candidatus Saccharibacteria bacterium]|nr:peptidase D-alanyl-D-alanine carboxypeptidase 1, D-alanyl-D-alanine carboxypeptidase [Candidatus Saccharibacteria bacterium]